MSNAERQREFLERNPDYYRLRYAKEKARLKALAAQRAAAPVLALPEPLAVPAQRPPLMLPAPVEMLIIPGMNSITALPSPAPVLEPVSRADGPPALRSIAA
ncbi:MAG TPA: hypothetical protein VGR35_09975 [Tepidisphaeraceae bacterium]|nr:hypothetical protein [Tepidisphaeraceae bacterium]